MYNRKGGVVSGRETKAGSRRWKFAKAQIVLSQPDYRNREKVPVDPSMFHWNRIFEGAKAQ